MGNRLSHSAISKFQTCSKAYYYHYKERLREKVKSGALVFGSAIDDSLNALLKDQSTDVFSVFDKSFTFTELNKKQVYVPDSENIVYAESDFDDELLTEEDFEKLKKYGYNGSVECITNIGKLKSEKGWKNLPSEEKQLYNMANWLSMRRKGHLMLSSYKEEILPRIKKVLTVQKLISISNGEGDSIIGYVDAVVEWEDGRIVVFDHKTSSRQYEKDSVLTSPQLILYIYALKEEYNTRDAGFIVMQKNIIKNRKKVCSVCKYRAEKGSRHKTCSNLIGKKRCNSEWIETIDPKCDINFIIDTIPERAEDIVMENYTNISDLIKNGVFVRNLNACKSPFLCPFINLCWKNDASDLEKV